jgi:integrase/recombinase XerD
MACPRETFACQPFTRSFTSWPPVIRNIWSWPNASSAFRSSVRASAPSITLALNTQMSYVQQVSQFARHFNKSPELLGRENIRAYQVYLTNEKKLAPGSVLIAVAALRFLYKISLKKDWTFEDVIPAPKKPQTLPVVLSPEDVLDFLGCVGSTKHRAILTTCYAAGLRISEVVHLKLTDVDSQRMVIRVEQGKGQKDRYVMLSPKLLETLRSHWRAVRRQGEWLFEGDISGQPITTGAVELACWKAHRLSRIRKPIRPHSMRHAFAAHLLESRSDVRIIQLLLGHRSLATTTAWRVDVYRAAACHDRNRSVSYGCTRRPSRTLRSMRL